MVVVVRIVAAVVALSCALAGTASARKPTIAVLSFGGPGGAAARARLGDKLGRAYRVLDGETLLAACEELGVPLNRGSNLALAATHVGAGAVIGGSIKGSSLALAVYSGETGEPVALGKVTWTRKRRDLRGALVLVLRGLRKAPRRFGADGDASPADAPGSEGSSDATEDESPTAVEPSPAKPATGPGPMTFAPDPVEHGATRPTLPLAPGATAQQGGDENPAAATAKPAAKVTTGATAPRRRPIVVGEVGLGTWSRSFRIANGIGGGHPSYKSGSATALGVALGARPLAPLIDGPLARIWLRLRYRTVLGLSSAVIDGTGNVSGLPTSMSELLFDAGYRFVFGLGPAGLELDLGLGYGTFDFSIDWQGNTPTMPSAEYRFVLFGTSARFPFLTFADDGALGVHLRLDYRLLLGSGEIENTDREQWYGPASVGGIAVAAGLNATLYGVVARAEWVYTRYFYSFDDATDRARAGSRAAGGALDQLHALVFALGYAL